MVLDIREPEAPYPGLRSFEPYEAGIFFGRERHTDRLLEILQREHFLAVVGPSGSGKSSLVRAGLLPGLTMGSLGTGSDWRIAVLRPGDQPLRSLALSLLNDRVLGEALVPRNQTTTTAYMMAAEAELRRGPLGLVQLVQSAHRKTRPSVTIAPFNLLVLVDQFEELFTYAEAEGAQADEADAFVNLLLAASADATSRVHVALTMRTDFLGSCVRFLDLPEAINRSQYLTPRLNRGEIERAIRGPAEQFGGSIEGGLVAELINATGQNADQLPLVQHALARMWAEASRRRPVSPHIDWHVSEAVGGVLHALNQHASELWDALGARQQRLAEGLFRAITERREAQGGGQDVRRPQRLRQIADWVGCEWQELVPLVRHFAAPTVCFLQHGRELNEMSVIDLAHEALIRQWDRLRGWVANEAQRAAGLRRWQERAAEHAAAEGPLLVGIELARALEWAGERALSPAGQGDAAQAAERWRPTENWASRYAPPLVLASSVDSPAPEQYPSPSTFARATLQQTLDFIAASRAQQECEQKAEAERARHELDVQSERATAAQAQAARLRRTTIMFGFAAIFSSVLAVTAVYLWAEVRKSEQRVSMALQESTIRRLAAESIAMFTGQRAGGDLQGIRMALAAYQLQPSSLEVLGALQLMAYGDTAWLKAFEPTGHSGAVVFSPDGTRIALRGNDGTLWLWDTRHSEEPIGQLLKESSIGVSSMTFNLNSTLLASGGDDGTLRLWDARSGEAIGQFRNGHSSPVLTAAFSPDDTLIASGARDLPRLRLWNVRSGELMDPPLAGHLNGVSSIAFSPDGTRFVSGDWDTVLRLWDARGEPIGQPLRGHSKGVSSVAFSPDGTRIVSGADDATLRLWDAGSCKPIRQLKGHSSKILSTAFSPDGARIVSGGRDGTLRLWDARSGEEIGRPLKGHSSGVLTTAFSRDGTHIFSGGYDGTFRLWDARDGEPLSSPLRGLLGSASSIAFSFDGTRVVSGDHDGTLRLWDLHSRKPIGQPLKGHSSSVLSVAISPDGTLIASGGRDATIRIWDMHSGELIGMPLKGHSDAVSNAVSSVAFSPDGARLVSGAWDNTLRLWDVRSGEPIGRPLKGHSGGVQSVAFSPEGTRIASGDWLGAVRLWDASTGDPIGQPVTGHLSGVLSIAFSRDASHIVTGSLDSTIRLWDVRSGEPIDQPLKGHSGGVKSVAFSADGNHIVSGSWDSTLRLWDVSSREPIGQPLKWHSTSVLGVTFSPDGTGIVSFDEDAMFRLWPAPVVWVPLLCAKLGRNFSPSEWQLFIGYRFAYREQCPGLPVPKE